MNSPLVMMLPCRSFRCWGRFSSGRLRYTGVSTMVVLRAGRSTVLCVAVIPRLVMAVEINVEEEVDALALGLQGGKQLRRGEHIVDIIMEHVKVIEDVGGFGEAL